MLLQLKSNCENQGENQKENQTMRTLFYSSEVKFKPTTPIKTRLDIIKSLEDATEHKWLKRKDTYSSREFSIVSNLDPRIIFLMIKEVKDQIQEFKFRMHQADALPFRIINLSDNRLSYHK